MAKQSLNIIDQIVAEEEAKGVKNWDEFFQNLGMKIYDAFGGGEENQAVSAKISPEDMEQYPSETPPTKPKHATLFGKKSIVDRIDEYLQTTNSAGLFSDEYPTEAQAQVKTATAETPSDKVTPSVFTPKEDEPVMEYLNRILEEKGARQEVELPKGQKTVAESKESKVPEEPETKEIDIEAIAKKYGGEISPSGGILTTDKEIPESEGLTLKGYIKNEETGGKTYLYAKPEIKRNEKGEGKEKLSERDLFEKMTIKRIGFDPTTFNPYTETKKQVEAELSQLFAWTFGTGVNRNDLTPAQEKHWEANVKDFFNEKLKENLEKQKLGAEKLKTQMAIYDKKHAVKTLKTKEGDIYRYNPDKDEYELMMEGPKKETAIPANITTEIEKLVDRIFLDDAEENKLLMGQSIYNSLPKEKRAEHDKIREMAERIVQDALNSGKRITATEAVRQAAETSKKPATKGEGKILDKETARAILKEAKGDKALARKIAKEKGYIF